MKTTTINNLIFTQCQIEQLSNGCGSKNKPFGWIKPPYRIFFEASCDIHDVNYWIGVTKQDRKKADKGFLKYMKKDCKLFFKWYNVKRYYYLLWARLYYIGVRIGGGKSFNYSVKKTQEDINNIKKKNGRD